MPSLALLGVGVLGLAAALAVADSGPDTAGAPANSPGVRAPMLGGRTLTGEPFDLAGLHGTVVLVNLFASWCASCRDELPILVDAHRRWSARGLRVVGLNIRDSAAAVEELLDQTGARELTILPDPTGATAVDWGARGVPETFLVDRRGRIAHRAAGPVTAQWIDQRLAPLLAP